MGRAYLWQRDLRDVIGLSLIRSNGISTVTLHFLRRLNSLRDAFHNACALAGASARLRPEAVNAHHIPTGVLARLGAAAARVKARHLLTIHVTEDPRMAPVAGLAGSFVFSEVLCVAEAVRDEVVRWAVPWRRDRFVVTRFGLDLPQALEKPGSLVGCVARLVPGRATLC